MELPQNGEQAEGLTRHSSPILMPLSDVQKFGLLSPSEYRDKVQKKTKQVAFSLKLLCALSMG